MALLVTTNEGLLASGTFSGNGAAITNLTRANISAGTPNYVLINNGLGAISESATLAPALGGTGFDASASTGVLKVASGTYSATTIVNADVDAAAAIARTKLANGSADQVVINSAGGVMTSEAQLAASRGGTGTDSSLSNGLAKVSTGAWSYSALVDADVSPTAAIARSKLANGTPSQVLINSPGGAMTSEAQLAVARGGTGQDFSASGPGPFAIQLVSGVFSPVSATPTAVASTFVTRDVSGATAVSSLTTSSVTSSGSLSVTAAGNLTLDPVGNVIVGDSPVVMIPTGISGGKATQQSFNLSMSGAAFVTAWSYPTVANTSYLVMARLAGIDVTGGVGTITCTFQYRAKNIAGTITKAADQNTQRSREAPINTASARGNVNLTSLLAEVSAVAGRTIKWCGVVTVIEQAL